MLADRVAGTGDIGDDGPEDGLEIDALVFVEPGVLGGEQDTCAVACSTAAAKAKPSPGRKPSM